MICSSDSMVDACVHMLSILTILTWTLSSPNNSYMKEQNDCIRKCSFCCVKFVSLCIELSYMYWKTNVSFHLKCLNNIVVIFTKLLWQIEFVTFFHGQVPVGYIMASSFMIIINPLIITIDTIQFIFTHFVVFWCLWMCFLLKVLWHMFHLFVTRIIFAFGSIRFFK